MANWVQEKIKNWGEKVMEQMIDSIVANQDTHLTNLQQWNVAKFIDRTLKAKYFYKQPSIINPVHSPTNNVFPKSLSQGPVGIAHVHVNQAQLLLFGSSINSSKKNSTFKLITKFGREKPNISESYAMEHTNQYIRTVKFDEKITHNINDLWSDILLEVHSFKPNETEISFDQLFNAPALSIESIVSSQDSNSTNPNIITTQTNNETDSLLTPTNKSQLKSEVLLSTPSTSFNTATTPSNKIKKPIQTNVNNSKSHYSTLYGRAIIPINSFLNSFDYYKDEKSGYYVTENEFWLHLYPNNNRLAENKFFRPIPGYEEFGMKHPHSTLGFIKVIMKFEWQTHPMIGPLISNIYTPTSNWVVPENVEPHFFESFIDRAHNIITTPPRWLSKVLPYVGCKRNHSDWLCISLFWVTLFYTLVLSNLTTFPLGVCAMFILISLTYRIGAEPTSPIGFYTNASRRCDPKRKQVLLPYNPISMWSKKSGLDNTSTKQELSSPKEIKTATSQSNPNPPNKSNFKTRMMYNKISLKTHTLEPLNKQPQTFLDTKNKSCIQSPFGDLNVNIKQSQLSKSSPIFSDDAGEPVISEQLQKLIDLFTVIQKFTGNLAMASEKLRYAFNWEDPYTTLLTYWTLLINTLFLTIITFFVQFLPLWLIRMIPFFFSIYFFFWLHNIWNEEIIVTPSNNLGNHHLQGDEILSQSSRSESAASLPDHFSNTIYTDEGNADESSSLSEKSAQVKSPIEIIPTQTIIQLKKLGYSLYLSFRSIFLNSSLLSLSSTSSPTFSLLILFIYQSFLVLQHTLCNLYFYSLTFIDNLTVHKYISLPISTVFWKYKQHWWMRIPDCREMDHRSISSTQLFHTLSQLLPADATTIDADEYLKNYFKNPDMKDAEQIVHLPIPYIQSNVDILDLPNLQDDKGVEPSILPETGLYSDLLNLRSILETNPTTNIESSGSSSPSSSSDLSRQKETHELKQELPEKSDKFNLFQNNPQFDQLFYPETYHSFKNFAESASRIFVRRSSKRDSISKSGIPQDKKEVHNDKMINKKESNAPQNILSEAQKPHID